MDEATGEAEGTGLRVAFDRRLKLEFHGASVTSDAGLLAFRELDDALVLTALAAEVLADPRNGRHSLIAQLRQSVFGRLAGYEDVNEASRDPRGRASGPLSPAQKAESPCLRGHEGGTQAHGRDGLRPSGEFPLNEVATMTVGTDIAWTKMINPELVDLGQGKLSLKQTPLEIHLNHNGDMNAGVLFSMSEMAGMGVVVLLLGELATNTLVVVKKVNIDFLARASGAITFTGTMEPEQQQRAIDNAKAGIKVEEMVKVEATDAEGKIVSRSLVTAVIAPKR